MRREWIEISEIETDSEREVSPSMRREWIEMSKYMVRKVIKIVSLHAEGVD